MIETFLANAEPSVPPVRLEHLHNFTGGNPAEDKKLCLSFLGQAGISLRELEQSCESGNNAEWRNAAHKLKGSAGNLGAFALAGLCDEAERNADAPPQKKMDYVKNIRRELDSVQKFTASIAG